MPRKILHSARREGGLILCAFSIFAAFAAPAAIAAPPPGPAAAPVAAAPEAPPCGLLDDLAARPRMGGIELRLLRACGRVDGLGGVAPASSSGCPSPLLGGLVADAAVNHPRLDAAATFGSHTQSETALARGGATGTLCAGYNDSYHLLTEENGFSGFSRSADGGATWEDRGALGAASAGGPALAWRQADGRFYYAAQHAGGIGLWRSADDCGSFVFAGLVPGGGSGDKQRLVADNSPASPRFGRLYAVFTDFSRGRIVATSSSDGGVSWSPAVPISPSGEIVQNAWPALAENGDLYAAWTRWQSFPDGPIAVRAARSSDGGATFVPLAPPLESGVPARDADASAACGRPALAGPLRHLPAPQLAVGEGTTLHVVYARDPDGAAGDASDVYYRRSPDGGASWGAERRLAEDAAGRDQFSPALAAAGRAVSVSWHDRRRDPANLEVDRFQRLSADGGRSWGPETRLSDAAAPIRLDPDLPTCYHGDDDQQLFAGGHAVVLWADDRQVQDGHHDADVYAERLPAPLFGDGFETGDTSAWSAVAP